MGKAHERTAAKQLLRERAARRDGRGLARFMRRVLRHHGRPGVCVAGRWRELGANRRGSSSRAFCRGANAAMIRVILPAHLRTLARIEDELKIDVHAPVTQRSILDAIEKQYPIL